MVLHLTASWIQTQALFVCAQHNSGCICSIVSRTLDIQRSLCFGNTFHNTKFSIIVLLPLRSMRVLLITENILSMIYWDFCLQKNVYTKKNIMYLTGHLVFTSFFPTYPFGNMKTHKHLFPITNRHTQCRWNEMHYSLVTSYEDKGIKQWCR